MTINKELLDTRFLYKVFYVYNFGINNTTKHKPLFRYEYRYHLYGAARLWREFSL